MPRSTRRTVFRPDSPSPPPPPKKARAEKKEEEPPAPANAVLELFFGDPPEILDHVISYLDAYSLGRFGLVHRQVLVRPTHWQALLEREPAPPALAELPNDPLLRLQVWTKLTWYMEEMENMNSQHFKTGNEFFCRCRGKKREQCKLPNLFLGAFNNSTEELRNRFHYFVRFSYRSPDGAGHRLIWQGFCNRVYDDGDDPDSIWLNMGDRMSLHEKRSWVEMREYLELRGRHAMTLRNLGRYFGQHMKARNRINKLLSVTVIALDKTDYHHCHLVHASAGQTNLNSLQRRHSDPHRATEGFLAEAYLTFFNDREDASDFPYLCVQVVH